MRHSFMAANGGTQNPHRVREAFIQAGSLYLTTANADTESPKGSQSMVI
jgi:hypothetical protein